MPGKGHHPGAVPRDRLFALGESLTECPRKSGVPTNRILWTVKKHRSIAGGNSPRFGKRPEEGKGILTEVVDAL